MSKHCFTLMVIATLWQIRYLQSYTHAHEHVLIMCTLARPIGVWNSSVVSCLVYGCPKKVSKASLLAVFSQAHMMGEDWLLSHVVKPAVLWLGLLSSTERGMYVCMYGSLDDCIVFPCLLTLLSVDGCLMLCKRGKFFVAFSKSE